jgi:hypothetical protein
MGLLLFTEGVKFKKMRLSTRCMSTVQDLLRRLRYKYVATGDLAAVALTRALASEVKLVSYGNILYIENSTYHIQGFWKLPTWRRKFFVTLPWVSEGLWAVNDKTYVKVEQEAIEVVVDGKAYISRLNICGVAEGGRQDVVVHIVGTLRRPSAGLYYTAFRCSEWVLPIAREPLFERFAYNKQKFRNEFREVFIKGGRVVMALLNPTCREYSETVYNLYGSFVECKE